MTLDDLKKRATASELTLIEAVEKAIRQEVSLETRKAVYDYILKNPPGYHRPEGMEMRDWFQRMEKHLNPDTP